MARKSMRRSKASRRSRAGARRARASRRAGARRLRGGQTGQNWPLDPQGYVTDPAGDPLPQSILAGPDMPIS